MCLERDMNQRRGLVSCLIMEKDKIVFFQSLAFVGKSEILVLVEITFFVLHLS